MPQNPFLDILKRRAMQNVPQPTDEQRQAWDSRVASEQADDPMWKKVGRNAIDALTSFAVDDPLSIDPEASPGRKIGALAATVPILPRRLPAIAPEAYEHVKAGGLRLYSRLTDAFAKAPQTMAPAKARSVASQASKEEVDLRKLEQFLSGRGEMDQIPREEIMSHLAANPLELDVVRKGANSQSINDAAQEAYTQALNAENAFRHELDTRYGAGWQGPMLDPTSAGLPPDTRSISQAEWDQFAALEEARHRVELATDTHLMGTEPRWDQYQTPGPKENYGESLINLPRHPDIARLHAENEQISVAMDQVLQRAGVKKLPGTTSPKIGQFNHAPEMWDEYADLSDRFHANLNKINGIDEANTFQSSHVDEPNNLVWSRHNDRRLNPTRSGMLTPQEQDAAKPFSSWGEEKPFVEGGSKGRFVEEIQSDWHQQGRDQGYRPPDINVQLAEANKAYEDAESARVAYIHDNPDVIGNPKAPGLQPYWNASVDAEARVNHLRTLRDRGVPDAPFKDTYHELALKQQLLDWANDPELEWFGVADATTAGAMEDHPYLYSGMQQSYDAKNPSGLAKLLNPYGVDVEHKTLPFNRKEGSVRGYENYSVARPDPKSLRKGARDVKTIYHTPEGAGKGEPIATMLQGDVLPSIEMETLANINERLHPGVRLPDSGKARMWGFGSGVNMSREDAAELQTLIRERGFPALAALIALQQSFAPRNDQ